MRQLYFFLFIIITGVSNADAQDSVARNTQLQQVLGMSKQQYEGYRKRIQEYDSRMHEVLINNSLDDKSKAIAMSRLMQERRTYMQQELSEEQRKKLQAFNRQSASLYSNQKKAAEGRLKQKRSKSKTITNN